MIIFVTGISGSGKSTALSILEDSGFYCIDNAPLNIIPKIIDIAQKSNITNIAFIIDPRMVFISKRDNNFFNEIRKFTKDILSLAKKYSIKIMFLDCEETVLIKRYNSSRRVHPLNPENVQEGIKLEKQLLKELKENSDFLIDTSLLSPYELSQKISEIIFLKKINILKLISFGYKYGFINTDFVIDTRVLKNPFYIKELSTKTGLEEEVKKYLLKESSTIEFLNKTIDYIDYILNIYFNEVKIFLEIGIGCTGGKHRSVFVTEYIYEKIKDKYPDLKILVEHRDIHKN